MFVEPSFPSSLSSFPSFLFSLFSSLLSFLLSVLSTALSHEEAEDCPMLNAASTLG